MANPLTTLLRVLRRQPRPLVYPPELLRHWTDAAVRAAQGADFFYDARVRRLAEGPPAIEAALSGVSGVVFVYPVRQGNATIAVVFVTGRTLTWTTGYVVTTSNTLPARHRPGAFTRLDPVDVRVYHFESP